MFCIICLSGCKYLVPLEFGNEQKYSAKISGVEYSISGIITKFHVYHVRVMIKAENNEDISVFVNNFKVFHNNHPIAVSYKTGEEEYASLPKSLWY